MHMPEKERYEAGFFPDHKFSLIIEREMCYDIEQSKGAEDNPCVTDTGCVSITGGDNKDGRAALKNGQYS